MSGQIPNDGNNRILANLNKKIAAFELRDATFDNAPDLVCLSHLRWNFVYQRPQHLMSRCARERRVFYVEEPVFQAGIAPQLQLEMTPGGVCVVVPLLPEGMDEAATVDAQRQLIDELFTKCAIRDCILWYYTPMALRFTRHVIPLAVAYDCMDELSGFRGAHGNLRQLESELLARADVVFTGGFSLFEAKRTKHHNVHAFPSSIDRDHFSRARAAGPDPADQAAVPHPRIGFAGVIDERMDMQLVDGVAAARPDWHFVMLGPVVKLDRSEIPSRPNIHYLGMKSYDELPAYMSGWDVAILPFAHNESTRYISPTKTPEYLAAGRRVVSTSIRDVVRSYGYMGLVRIADTVPEFVAAIEESLAEDSDQSRLAKVDAYLAQNAWGKTWGKMMQHLDSAMTVRESAVIESSSEDAQEVYAGDGEARA